MIELTKEQKLIVEAPEDKIVVMSAAATGKTRVLTERVRWILNNGANPSKVVCITFTNNAADEIKTRLGDDYKMGMYIGTVHGYANYLLMSHGVDTKNLRDNEEFDKLFGLVQANPNVVEPVDFLALDESQDSSDLQFKFIFEMVQPNSFLVLGDVRQSIYGFNGANPSLILNLCRKDNVVTYDMIENHRNGQKIIGYSNGILEGMTSIPKTMVKGLRETEGLVLKIGENEQNFIDLIKKSGSDYSKWAILCRTNAKISSVMAMLKKNKIPSITFKQAQGDLNILADKMRENSVKVLTIHSAKGLEWPNVIVADHPWKGEENLRVNYVAVTRARDELYLVNKFA